MQFNVTFEATFLSEGALAASFMAFVRFRSSMNSKVSKEIINAFVKLPTLDVLLVFVFAVQGFIFVSKVCGGLNVKQGELAVLRSDIFLLHLEHLRLKVLTFDDGD